jgi:pimeloyl-ACP methyl ester carboxylesterase
MAVTKVKVRDGVQIACEARGSTKASPPLVLVHSLGMDRTFWDAVATPLTDTTTVLTYDCRGHGVSDKPEGSYLVEQFADDLADLVDHFNWHRVVVAGASMGGCVALATAAAYPDRVAGLGLFDTTAGYHAPDTWEERAAAAETRASQQWSNSRPRAGSATRSAPATRTWSTRPLRCFLPTRRAAMLRPAGCSASSM